MDKPTEPQKVVSRITKNNTSNQSQPGGQRQMYPATCHQCGKACEVPFAPAPNKPIYCADCFAKRKLAVKTQISAKQHVNNVAKNENGSGDIKQQLGAINSKLDRLIQMLDSKESTPTKTKKTVAPVKKVAKKKAVSKKK